MAKISLFYSKIKLLCQNNSTTSRERLIKHNGEDICIVTPCSWRGRKAWKVIAPHISRFIKRKSHQLLVPSKHLRTFTKNSPKEIDVIAEEDIISPDQVERIREAICEPFRFKYMWYLQQFIKIKTCMDAKTQYCLIWDADTMPIRNLSFINADGKLNYYKSSEYHAPYFSTIQRILNINIKTPAKFSFISQCFICKPEWVREFVEKIEEHTKQEWMIGIINSMGGKELYEFSEYESLGHFMLRYHPESMNFTDRKWHRFGNSKYGGPREVLRRKEEIAEFYDFISFEKWDKVPKRSIYQYIKSSLRSSLRSSLGFISLRSWF